MERVTAREIQNNFGEYSLKAERKPVAITKYGKTRLVLLSIEDFMKLLGRAQEALHVSELTAEQLDSIYNAEAPAENEHLNALLED